MELQVIIYKGLNADYAVPRYIVANIMQEDANSLKVTVFDSISNSFEDVYMYLPFLV